MKEILNENLGDIEKFPFRVYTSWEGEFTLVGEFKDDFSANEYIQNLKEFTPEELKGESIDGYVTFNLEEGNWITYDSYGELEEDSDFYNQLKGMLPEPTLNVNEDTEVIDPEVESTGNTTEEVPTVKGGEDLTPDREFLHRGMQDELQTIVDYKIRKQNSKDPLVQEILEDIIAEEEKHVGQFQAGIAKLDAAAGHNMDAGQEEVEQLEDKDKSVEESQEDDPILEESFNRNYLVKDANGFYDIKASLAKMKSLKESKNLKENYEVPSNLQKFMDYAIKIEDKLFDLRIKDEEDEGKRLEEYLGMDSVSDSTADEVLMAVLGFTTEYEMELEEYGTMLQHFVGPNASNTWKQEVNTLIKLITKLTPEEFKKLPYALYKSGDTRVEEDEFDEDNNYIYESLGKASLDKMKSLKEDLEVNKKDKLFYGIPGVEFIWNGTYSDPEVEYKGKRYNYYDLEESMWTYYKETCEEKNEEPTDEGFEKFILDNKDSVYSDLESFTPLKEGKDLNESKSTMDQGKENGNSKESEDLEEGNITQEFKDFSDEYIYDTNDDLSDIDLGPEPTDEFKVDIMDSLENLEDKLDIAIGNIIDIADNIGINKEGEEESSFMDELGEEELEYDYLPVVAEVEYQEEFDFEDDQDSDGLSELEDLFDDEF